MGIREIAGNNRWKYPGDSGKFTPEAIAALLGEVMSLPEVAEGMGFQYDTLIKAARAGRIQARQSGATWLTTIAAVKRAIAEGKLRKPREE
jgi:hypothetical protein